MAKLKKFSRFFVSALLVLCVWISAHAFVFKAFAEEEQADADAAAQNLSGEQIAPQGIYTSLSLGISGGRSVIMATVKNDLTIFPSTVKVYVELYASTTRQPSYLYMTQRSQNKTEDLNMGESISTSAPTYGEELYWQARMFYKIDSKAWEERVTDILLYDAAGNLVS